MAQFIINRRFQDEYGKDGVRFKNKPFILGVDAKRKGWLITENPYPPDTLPYTQWNLGWNSI